MTISKVIKSLMQCSLSSDIFVHFMASKSCNNHATEFISKKKEKSVVSSLSW